MNTLNKFPHVQFFIFIFPSMNRMQPWISNMNATSDRDNKLAALRWDPIGPRPVIDYTLIDRPMADSFRREEKNGR
jgi:hypothetical protein